MTRASSWWRKVGTALAALVLTMFTFGPGLDSMVCQDEMGLGAAAAELSVAAAPDHDAAGHANDGAGACIHGHCHHGATYVPATPVAAEAPDEHAGRLLPVVRARVRTSDPKYGLRRPPRG